MKQNKIKSLLYKIIIFIILIAGMSAFSYIPVELFNIDIQNFNNVTKTIYLVTCDIGYILTVYLAYRKKINKNFKEFFKNFTDSLETSFKYYFIGLIIMFVSNILIGLIFKNATAGNEETVRNYIDNYPVYMLFSVAIYAPFIEEIIFRKSIKDCVSIFKNNKITKYIYVILSGGIFALMHILGQTTSPIDYIYIIPYMALGVSFALLYYKTDNIFSTIIIHSLHNTVTFILYILAGGI